MRTYENKIIVLILIFLFFIILPAVGQEEQQFSQEERFEFLMNLRTLAQERNIQKICMDK